MGCKAFIPHFFRLSHPDFFDRFRWVDCQLAYLADCIPRDIQDILNRLPATLDETYERTLREIKDSKWELCKVTYVVAHENLPSRQVCTSPPLKFPFASISPACQRHLACQLHSRSLSLPIPLASLTFPIPFPSPPLLSFS